MSEEKKEITYYLEMRNPDQHRPRESADRDFCVREVQPVDPELNRRFYRTVGESYEWDDQREWSSEQWAQHIRKEGLVTFVAYSGERELGYFELAPQGTEVELLYFGLLPDAVGKGYGSAMLSQAIDRAWSLLCDVSAGSARVWVHTCNFDHPNALGNYQRLGFVHYRTEHEGDTQ